MKAEITNIVNRNRNELHKVLPLETPYSLFVDVCNVCNFKCKFCAIQYAERELPFRKMSMEYDLFRKVMDDLKEFPEPLKMLRLATNGEPLLNKRLPDMIRYAKEGGVSEWVEIVSNASLLSPELNRQLISAGLDRIRISIEGIGAEAYYEMSGVKIDWDEFVANIRDLFEHKGNCEIYIKTVDAAVPTEEERNLFFATFGNICDKIYIEHVIPIWAGYDEINEDFAIGNKGLHDHKVKEVDVCPFPFYSCVVHPDGEVTVCCGDWERKISIGNVLSESLYDIWNGEKYFSFLHGMLEKGRKANHPAGCAKCNSPCFDAVDDLDSNRVELLTRFRERAKYKSNKR